MTLQSRLKLRTLPDLTNQAILSMLVATGYLYARLEEICERHGITHDQFNILRILRGAYPDGHPRYEIAQRLINRSPDVTRFMQRLERQDLIEKVRSNEDKRLSISRITPKGLGVLKAIQPELDAMHRELTARLTENDLRDLARICGLLVP